MRTRARRDGDDWVLNGSKMWITNGTLRRRRRRLGADRRRDPRLRGPDRHAGLHRHQDPAQAVAAGLGHRRAGRSTTCGCPATRCSPRCAGSRGRCRCLNEARYGILWGAVGAARACYEEALAYSLAARAVRQAAGVVPADPEEARRHGDRGQQRLARRRADRPAQGRGRRSTPAQVRYGKLANVRAAARGRPHRARPCSAAPASPWTTR